MTQLTSFDTLSFDCYGTLIDWETGIRAALKPWRERVGIQMNDDQFVEAFGRHEWVQETETPDMPYPGILARVLKRMAAEWGVDVTETETLAFGRSVGDWPAFPDSTAALQYLKQHYKLVILSNIDREIFRHSNARLRVDFDHIFTAQDIGSYKPDPRNFHYMVDRLAEAGLRKEKILHTAESLYHDHVPAQKLGLATNWIYRRHAQAGFGATRVPDEDVRPHFRFDSMADFVVAHRALAHAA